MMRQLLIIGLVMLLLGGCGSTSEPTSQPTDLPANNSSSLTDTRWKVDMLNGKLVAGSNPLPFAIDASNQVSGNGGCNGYGGPIMLDGTNLRIGPLVSTMMACADMNIQNQETALLQALEKVRSYQQEATSLSLLDADGAVIITLARQP